jgi:hypothetical protein
MGAGRAYLWAMKQPVLAASLALALTTPAIAQEEDRGLSLMEEGARLFFRGILQEMEPALDEMQDLAEDLRPALRDFAATMGPALQDLLSEVEDWSVYHPPEMLPNGDIILRRKTPKDPAPLDEGEIEL